MRPAARILAILSVFGAIAIGLLLLMTRERPTPPPPTTVEIPVVPPPPTGPVTIDVAGGEGPILEVAGPERSTLSAEGRRAILTHAAKEKLTALLVWHRGGLQIEWYGTGVRPSDRQEGAGLTALPLALLGLTSPALSTDGGLEKPVRTWVPEWGGDPRGGITPRDLLQGTSGLAGEAPPTGGSLTDGLLATPLEAGPGTRLAPRDIELRLLALILTRAEGRSFDSILTERLWRPVGARAATLTLDQPEGLPPLPCCLAATPRDWLRLGLLLLDKGTVSGARVVPPAELELLTRPSPFSRHRGLRTRLAWPRERDMPFTAAEPFIEADTVVVGEGDGNRLYVSAAADLVILRLGPGQGPGEGKWDESHLANLVSRALTVRAPRGKTVPSQADAPLPPVTRPPPMPKVETVPLP